MGQNCTKCQGLKSYCYRCNGSCGYEPPKSFADLYSNYR